MDLKDLKPVGSTVEILHPGTGENLNIKVDILSINDPQLENIKRRITDENLRLERKGKFLKSTDIEKNREELAFAAMTGWVWEGESTFNGEKPEFNRKNVLAVFREHPWFREQIEEAVSNDADFFTS